MIPSNWTEATLEEISSENISYGVIQPGDTDSNGVFLIRGGDFPNGKIKIDSLRTISKELSLQYSRTILRGGELLVSLVGYPGAVTIVPEKLAGANIARQAALIRLKEMVTNDFIFQYLSSPVGQSKIKEKLLGSAQQVINLKDLRELIITLPSKDEQKKIANIFSSVDRVIELTSMEIDKLKDLKKGMMKELLTKGIGHTKFKDSPVGKIPESWEVAASGEIAEGIVPGRDKPKSFTGNIPWLTMPDLKKFYVEKSQADLNVTEEEAKIAKNKILPIGTVIMSCVGNLGIISILKKKSVINQQLHAFVCSNKIIPEFLAFYLEFISPRLALLAGQTTIPYMNKEACNGILIGLPSLDEQEKIIKLLFSVYRKIESLELKLMKLNIIKKGLTNDLLTGKIRVKV